MSTVLITGGCGFIGSNFVRYWRERHPDDEILVLDALTYAGNVENLPGDPQEDPQVEFWYGDVRNAGLVDQLVGRSDVVVHFAAESHVTRSIFDNREFFETDVLGTQTVANSVLQHKDSVQRFLHISTSEVYGTAVDEAMHENHPLLPASPYAAAKAGADLLVQSYVQTYELPVVVVRPFNNYGPFQHLEKVLPRFITSVLMDEPMTVHGDGSSARDFVHVRDHCRALEMLIEAPSDKVTGEVFNVGSGEHRSVRSLAEDVCKVMDVSTDMIAYIGDRPGQVVRHTAGVDKIRETIGWQPEIDWLDGVREAVDWYTQNKEWWRHQLWLRHIEIVSAAGRREMH